jgi:hypothetical protein
MVPISKMLLFNWGEPAKVSTLMDSLFFRLALGEVCLVYLGFCRFFCGVVLKLDDLAREDLRL